MATSRLSGTKKILAVLLDVTGVLYESGEGDGKAIKGSMEAVSRSGPQYPEVGGAPKESCSSTCSIIQSSFPVV